MVRPQEGQRKRRRRSLRSSGTILENATGEEEEEELCALDTQDGSRAAAAAASTAVEKVETSANSHHHSTPSLSQHQQEENGHSHKTTSSTTSTQSNLFPSRESSSSMLAPATQFPSRAWTKNTTAVTASCDSNLPGSSRSNSHNSKANTIPTRAAASQRQQQPSLFGAVMKNVLSTTTTTTTTTDVTASSAFGSMNVSTPSRRTATSSNALNLSTPGGFGLQDMVANFSPFQFKSSLSTPSPRHTGTPSSSRRRGAATTTADVLLSTPRRNVEWHECRILQPQPPHTIQSKPSSSPQRRHRRQLNLIDWSLKASLQVQCQPSSFRWTTRHNTDTAVADHVVQQRAMQTLLMPTSNGTTTDPYTAWKAGLLYWQHPASPHPWPKELWSGTEAGGTAKSTRKGDPMNGGGHSSSSHSRLFPGASSRPTNHHKQQQPQQPHAFSTMTANDWWGPLQQQQYDDMDGTTVASQRAREWRAAFRSLYQRWIERVQALEVQWRTLDRRRRRHYDDRKVGNDSNRTQNDDDDDIAGLAGDVADTYFYARGYGHTILFRVGIVEDPEEMTDDGDRGSRTHLVPEIVVSSSTLALRNCLRAMEVQLFLLHDWNGMRGEFSEQAMLETTRMSRMLSFDDDNKVEKADESPTVKAELVALRRAQVYGQTVGADVSVQMRSKGGNNMLARSPRRIPPLYMRGFDDCASFFEVYFNSLGQIGVGKVGESVRANELVHDVPLLMCRKLGPFLFSTMAKLRESISREMSDEGDKLEGISTIDLHGCILPCAVRDLVCATVAQSLQLQEEGNSIDRSNNDADDHHSVRSSDDVKEEDIGSRQLVVRATSHTGTEAHAVVEDGIIGSHSSKWLNSQSHGLPFSDDEEKMQHCRYDEVLMLAVWDVSKPHALVYKLEHQSANLLE